MLKPTKQFQVWHDNGEGYSFDEFDYLDDVTNFLVNENYSPVFVTKLVKVTVVEDG